MNQTSVTQPSASLQIVDYAATLSVLTRHGDSLDDVLQREDRSALRAWVDAGRDDRVKPVPLVTQLVNPIWNELKDTPSIRLDDCDTDSGKVLLMVSADSDQALQKLIVRIGELVEAWKKHCGIDEMTEY